MSGRKCTTDITAQVGYYQEKQLKNNAMESWKEPITLPVTLNASDWSELVYALSSKAAAIRNGNYGERDGREGFSPEAWARQLERIYQKLDDLLATNNIPF
jgi:hypothetical protein